MNGQKSQSFRRRDAGISTAVSRSNTGRAPVERTTIEREFKATKEAPSTANVTDELMVKFSTACGFVEEITGDRPHPATCYRWNQRGLFGVKLKAAYVGGHKRTCRKWIREFFAEINSIQSQLPAGNATETITPRQREIQRARQQLAGI